MKELKEFEKMGVSKSEILYHLGSGIYNCSAIRNDEETVWSYFVLVFENKLQGEALSTARCILREKQNQLCNEKTLTSRRIKQRREKSLRAMVQALKAYGWLGVTDDCSYLHYTGPGPRRVRRRRIRRG